MLTATLKPIQVRISFGDTEKSAVFFRQIVYTMCKIQQQLALAKNTGKKMCCIENTDRLLLRENQKYCRSAVEVDTMQFFLRYHTQFCVL